MYATVKPDANRGRRAVYSTALLDGAERTLARAPYTAKMKIVSDGKNPFFVDELGRRLGIFTKSASALLPQRLQRYLLQDQAAKLLPKERVCHCLKKRIDSTKNRTVMYNEVRETAHYGNVQRCGSIWSCPVCAGNITEKRRLELKTGVDKWKEMGGGVLLLTLTNSHTASHSLNMLLAGQKTALKYFFSDRLGKLLFSRIGKQHQIRTLEVTHGRNGWHPHHHILLLTKNGKFDSQIREELARHWINCCKKAGLPLPTMEHGLDLRDGSYADQYVGKWGIEHEMTKGHVKKGREGGLTPFDLLRISCEQGAERKEDDDARPAPRAAAKLFQEFAIAFKGKRQLFWSKGLKALLLIEEKTDEQLADETENVSIELLQVEPLLFGLLCKYQTRENLLSAAEYDYKNGLFGNGRVQDLIADVVRREIIKTEQAFSL